MEFEAGDNKIVFEKELSSLDKLVLRFVKTLGRLEVDYAIIYGML